MFKALIEIVFGSHWNFCTRTKALTKLEVPNVCRDALFLNPFFEFSKQKFKINLINPIGLQLKSARVSESRFLGILC